MPPSQCALLPPPNFFSPGHAPKIKSVNLGFATELSDQWASRSAAAGTLHVATNKHQYRQTWSGPRAFHWTARASCETVRLWRGKNLDHPLSDQYCSYHQLLYGVPYVL